ncbi:MAG: hypothetical protein IJX99_04480 [Clostridia bacterium]|nr:hypothetical protein [Clostridia bacterium]
MTGVEAHKWTGGNTTAHKCSGCSYTHSKANDATKGLHYFNLDKIRVLGDVSPCAVCGEYLKLEYSSDSILDTLPKKEEYTMIGNPNPMEEVTLDTDQKIVSNFMPIDENGEIILLEEIYLRVRSYTNGNYYRHYSKLIGNELSKITDRVQYMEESGTIDYIANELSSFGALGGYNEAKKQEIVDNVTQMVKDDPNLNFLDVYAITTVVSKLGDFAINSINTPLLEWFTQDLAIKNTWISGGIETIRHDFKGDMASTAGREYTLYFSELPANKYEILLSPILTYGVNFNIFSYSIGGIGQLLFSTLFTVGDGGSDPPSNILAYVSIAYRDDKGNVIYTKAGDLATPKDTVISRVVYSGTSAKSVTSNISAQMEWTQLSGYRYKGYLLKYGTNTSGNYKVYNNPSEMKVTTDSSVSVTSSFTPSRLRNKFSVLF